MGTPAFRYPDGRPMRAGVRADGSYLPTIHGRTAKALDLQPDEVREAIRLFSGWIGSAATAVDARRLAHLIGCGHPPHAAAAREYGYRLALACCPDRQIFRPMIPHLIGM